MFKVIVQECKMSTESEKERASDVANGCKLIAVMWILIPINQGQCGLLCHLCAAGKKGSGGRRRRRRDGMQVYVYICCRTVYMDSQTIV